MNKYVKLLIGILISIAGLFYAFQSIDLGEVGQYLHRVNYGLILLSATVMILSVVVRARRWQLILREFDDVSLHTSFAASMVGYFGNSILPFRMGEILRGLSLAKETKVSPGSAFGTIVLERIIDVMGLLVTIIFFAFLYPLSDWMNTIYYGIVAGLILFFVTLFVIDKYPAVRKKILNAFPIFYGKLGDRLLHLLTHFYKGMATILNTPHKGEIIFHTLLMWVMYYVSMYLSIRAVQVDINWIETGVILIASTFAISVPAAPGYVGTYHAVTVAVLTNLFNLPLSESQAFAVVVHALGIIPYIIIGFIYFVRSSIHLSDIRNTKI